MPMAQASPARQRLATMIQELEFGHIDGLHVARGEPLFSPRPRRKRVFNLTADDAHTSRLPGRDYRLRTLRALFRRLDAIQEPAIVSILVQDGLPVRLTICDPDEA